MESTNSVLNVVITQKNYLSLDYCNNLLFFLFHPLPPFVHVYMAIREVLL